MLLGLFILFGLATLIVLASYIGLVAHDVRHPKRQTAGWALAHSRASSPEDLGLETNDEWLLEVGTGISLPVWDIPADTKDSDTDAPVLVVLHGWGRSRIDSLARMKDILVPGAGARRDFRTILYELRGHGDAPRGPSTLGSRDIDDLEALLERIGPAPVVLLGHSLGAVIALHVAARNPEHVRAVVALAPYTQLAIPISGSLRARSYPGGMLAHAVGSVLAFRGARMENTIDVARRIQQPIFVLTGEDDQITPIAEGRAIAQAAPNGRFIPFPTVEHSNHHERQPALLSETVEQALSCARTAHAPIAQA